MDLRLTRAKTAVLKGDPREIRSEAMGTNTSIPISHRTKQIPFWPLFVTILRIRARSIHTIISDVVKDFTLAPRGQHEVLPWNVSLGQEVVFRFRVITESFLMYDNSRATNSYPPHLLVAFQPFNAHTLLHSTNIHQHLHNNGSQRRPSMFHPNYVSLRVEDHSVSILRPTQ